MMIKQLDYVIELSERFILIINLKMVQQIILSKYVTNILIDLPKLNISEKNYIFKSEPHINR
jgi:hypothetical protein